MSDVYIRYCFKQLRNSYSCELCFYKVYGMLLAWGRLRGLIIMMSSMSLTTRCSWPLLSFILIFLTDVAAKNTFEFILKTQPYYRLLHWFFWNYVSYKYVFFNSSIYLSYCWLKNVLLKLSMQLNKPHDYCI